MNEMYKMQATLACYDNLGNQEGLAMTPLMRYALFAKWENGSYVSIDLEHISGLLDWCNKHGMPVLVEIRKKK